jgi:hypothetical protein
MGADPVAVDVEAEGDVDRDLDEVDVVDLADLAGCEPATAQAQVGLDDEGAVGSDDDVELEGGAADPGDLVDVEAVGAGDGADVGLDLGGEARGCVAAELDGGPGEGRGVVVVPVAEGDDVGMTVEDHSLDADLGAWDVDGLAG